MKTRQSAISALLIFAVLLLSACGGGGGSSDGDSSGGGRYAEPRVAAPFAIGPRIPGSGGHPTGALPSDAARPNGPARREARRSRAIFGPVNRSCWTPSTRRIRIA